MMDKALRGRIILAVFAHPDDESLACGGTLARLAEEGFRVVVMCASHGERGGPTGPVRSDVLGHARVREMTEAATALGVAEVIVCDHPDGELRWEHVGELHAELVTYVRRHAPAAMITFGEDGLYWHPDHIGVHERTISAVRSLGADAPPVYLVTMARGVMTELATTARARGWIPPPKGFWSITPEAFGVCAEPPTLSVDVADWVPQKLEAILCHASQMVEGHPFTRLDSASSRRLLGVEYFHRADIPSRAPAVLEHFSREPERA
jgi:LmbE family N-acetylglucosaminyl deacetylase